MRLAAATHRVLEPLDDPVSRAMAVSSITAAALAAVVLSALVLGACGARRDAPVPGSDPRLGRDLVQTYGCPACHMVANLNVERADVGPPLDGLRTRAYVAGRLPTTPTNLVRWITDPQAVKPGTAMPDLGVHEEEAGHMAAYLLTLSDRSATRGIIPRLTGGGSDRGASGER